MKDTIQAHDLIFQPYLPYDTIQEKVEELGQRITKDYEGKRPIFVGMLNGAFMFLADLVRVCDLDLEISFVKISSYQGTTSTGKINLHLDITQNIENRDVIIVEDIIDTGQTMHHFLHQIEQKKPASVNLATLLVKPDALQFNIDMKYVGFEIPDKFVIGYGLDYNGLGRNLPCIYQLKKHT